MNKQRLKGYAILNGDTLFELANKIGISTSSMSERLQNRREFTAREISKIMELYKLSPDEVVEIFLHK